MAAWDRNPIAGNWLKRNFRFSLTSHLAMGWLFRKVTRGQTSLLPAPTSSAGGFALMVERWLLHRQDPPDIPETRNEKRETTLNREATTSENISCPRSFRSSAFWVTQPALRKYGHMVPNNWIPLVKKKKREKVMDNNYSNSHEWHFKWKMKGWILQHIALRHLANHWKEEAKWELYLTYYKNISSMWIKNVIIRIDHEWYSCNQAVECLSKPNAISRTHKGKYWWIQLLKCWKLFCYSFCAAKYSWSQFNNKLFTNKNISNI